MSKRDWLQLQAYKATDLTPAETNRAVCSYALLLQSLICDDTKKPGGCPGKEKCPLGAALIKALADKPDKARIGDTPIYTADSPCGDLAISYPAVVLRYFWETETKKMYQQEAHQ